LQALTAATALASEHSDRAEVEHARLAELEGLLEAKHKELEEAQVRRLAGFGGSRQWVGVIVRYSRVLCARRVGQ
jgi:hypothetical protein